MSINIDQPLALPGPEQLQQLANEIFKQLPQGFPKEVSLNPQEHPRAYHFASQLYESFAGNTGGSPAPAIPAGDNFNVANPQTSLPDPHAGASKQITGYNPVAPANVIPGLPETVSGLPTYHYTNAIVAVPPAFGGAGASLPPSMIDDLSPKEYIQITGLPYQPSVPGSVAGSGSSISASDVQHSNFTGEQPLIVPVAQNAGSGVVPKSVAGVGISPSAAAQGNAVDISNPKTSLDDPHFAGGGKIPASVAGSGKSPSLLDQHTTSEALPLAENSFDKHLAQIFQSFSVFETAPQLPALATGESPYYFLKSANHLPFVLEKPPFSSLHLPGALTDKLVLKSPPFDLNQVRKDFPILQERVNGHPLIWLDNAATTQKPRQVIDRVSHFYEHENSNIHRAAHALAARATDAYEAAREKVRRFINAASVNEIVFVRGTTEAINLVAKSWGEQFLNPGDEIILSHLEHHANIVPWQQLAAKKGLRIRVIPVDDNGQLILEEYSKLLNAKTKLVSFTQVSNALGTVTPSKAIIEMAHAAGAKVLLDAAQSISHLRTDVQALNPDWLVFSGHKVYGPTGIGVVYGKEALLNETEPWQGGGNMIVDVSFEKTVYHNAPSRFEAGTGNIADAVGLGAALDYVSKIGIDIISQYEHGLLEYATHAMKQVKGLKLIGTAAEKASVLSFVLEGFTNNEVGQELNKEGIAVRTGHHCAQPILRRFGLESTVRPSLAFYNTCAEVDKLTETLHQLKRK